MNIKQAEIMSTGKGFIAALDQSGGSTPKALKIYGISEDAYKNENEMFDLIHEMRTRIITSPAFTSEHILGAILFEQTMERRIEDMYTGDYLWEKKGIIPFLKVDKGLEPLDNGVQLMKPITDLDAVLEKAVQRKIFGTKMRSVIKSANPVGIESVIEQQFDYARRILNAGLVPIVEPEVDINIPDKAEAERLLKTGIKKQLASLSEGMAVMLKLTIPSEDGFYSDLLEDSSIMRIVALSGGYSREEACERLGRNPGLIASFSRALTEGLTAGQTDEQFNSALLESIKMIYKASV